MLNYKYGAYSNHPKWTPFAVLLLYSIDHSVTYMRQMDCFREVKWWRDGDERRETVENETKRDGTRYFLTAAVIQELWLHLFIHQLMLMVSVNDDIEEYGSMLNW